MKRAYLREGDFTLVNIALSSLNQKSDYNRPGCDSAIMLFHSAYGLRFADRADGIHKIQELGFDAPFSRKGDHFGNRLRKAHRQPP